MRKILPLTLAVSVLGLTACGANVQRVNENQFVVVERVGNYDNHDLDKTCRTIGRSIAFQSQFNLSRSSSGVLVTCTAPTGKYR